MTLSMDESVPMAIDKSTAQRTTPFEELLQSFDIKEFTEFLATKKYLSAFEMKYVQSLGGTKQDIISYVQCVASRDESGFIQVFNQFTSYVSERVSLALKTISRAEEGRSEARANTSSKFSFFDEPDFTHCSQQIPDAESDSPIERSGMNQDHGYFSPSNPLDLGSDSMLNEHQEKLICRQLPLKKHTPNSEKKKQAKVNTKNNYSVDSMLNKIDSTSLKKACLGSLSQSAKAKESQDIPPSHEFRMILRKYPAFMEYMDVPTLLPFLGQENLVTHDESEYLSQHCKGRQRQNRYLIQLLPSKGDKAQDRFRNCLSKATDHSGHADLVKLLRR